ncbi:hypothetical protein F4777DRAFT_600792 [Nemania sp. FL0916]|nr:hypothetical protein F4777DRAFT_600792 [Nemania sp. FL0916]
MCILKLAAKAVITSLMLWALHTADQYVLFLSMSTTLLLSSDFMGSVTPSFDRLFLVGVPAAAKHVETYPYGQDFARDMYVVFAAALYFIVGDKFRVLLYGAWLSYCYLDTDLTKCALYMALTVATLSFPSLRVAFRVAFRVAHKIFWPPVFAFIRNNTKVACSKLCTSLIKGIESLTPELPSHSLSPALPALLSSFPPHIACSTVMITANIEPSEESLTPELPSPSLSPALPALLSPSPPHIACSTTMITANIEPSEEPKCDVVDSATQTSSSEIHKPINDLNPHPTARLATVGVLSAHQDSPIKRREPAHIRKQRLRDSAGRGSITDTDSIPVVFKYRSYFGTSRRSYFSPSDLLPPPPAQDTPQDMHPGETTREDVMEMPTTSSLSNTDDIPVSSQPMPTSVCSSPSGTISPTATDIPVPESVAELTSEESPSPASVITLVASTSPVDKSLMLATPLMSGPDTALAPVQESVPSTDTAQAAHLLSPPVAPSFVTNSSSSPASEYEPQPEAVTEEAQQPFEFIPSAPTSEPSDYPIVEPTYDAEDTVDQREEFPITENPSQNDVPNSCDLTHEESGACLNEVLDENAEFDAYWNEV